MYPEKATVHESAIVHDCVKLGENVTVHEYCVIGSQGFGFVRDYNGEWLHIPHIGGVVIGNDVEVFAFTNIDRGTVGDTVVGNGTKIDHHCHIGHNSRIGEFCVITAMVVVCGSAIIGDNVWIGPNSAIMNGVRVGDGAYIGMGTNVIDAVPDGAVVVGNPGRVIRIGDQPHIKVG